MKGLIILAFLCMLAHQQNVLLSSSTSNTIIINPLSSSIAVESYHTTNNPNFIGYGAQWIWKGGSTTWPNNDEAQFQSVFYADCTSSATLYITADNIFFASLNGGTTFTGNNWKKVYKFALTNVRCGKNVLSITGVNLDAGSQAAVIFAVVQDPSQSCYNCKSPLSFYNSDTCQCQCLKSCDCARINDNYVYAPYPVCGCKCRTTSICFNPNFYWNDNTCTCQCKPISCLPGYAQNPGSCLCEKKPCVDALACAKPKVWSPTLCRCVCQKPVSCIYPLVWNENKCVCQSYKIDNTLNIATDSSPSE